MGLQTPVLSGFGWFFGVSCAGGHGVLLPTVVLVMHGGKATLSPKILDFKYFHGPYAVSRHRCAP
jgi:hypothetical protein